MDSVYNNQGRKSGGYQKYNIYIGKNDLPYFASIQCFENRHADCQGIDVFSGEKCECVHHEQLI